LAQLTQPPVSAPPDEAAVQQIFQLITGFMASAALGVVAELGVADHLADGPRSAADLAARTGANEDALYRVLRALAVTGVFAESSPRTFALTPAAVLLRANVPGSVRDLVLWLCDPFHFRVYAEMAHSVRTGETVGEKVVGMPVFEYLQREPELSARFNNAMTNFSAGVAPAMLEAYDFSGIGVLVDVAGGHGMMLASILRQYPRMRGVLFDVEHVIAGATAAEALGVADRCEKVSGDFFKTVPRGGDAYLMKHIIHDWDDERAGVILRNIRAALEGKAHGKVILVEAVVKPANEPDLSKLGDLEMMLLPGGRERTEAEFAALFARNGFQLTRVVPTQAPLWVVEAQIR
jgi:O-methyltransferase/methyltransferase family protein